MLGAIIGDIAGSRFERHNHKSNDFELLTMGCHVTDDSVMSIAICDALMNSKRDMSDLGANAVRSMQTYGNKYPGAGYGGMFRSWLISPNPQPYGRATFSTFSLSSATTSRPSLKTSRRDNPTKQSSKNIAHNLQTKSRL